MDIFWMSKNVLVTLVGLWGTEMNKMSFWPPVALSAVGNRNTLTDHFDKSVSENVHLVCKAQGKGLE